ncbi:MAG: hypothetical protein Q7S96_02545 [bacterium]|nr:hypothetical protein [bacterium]
MWEDLDKKEKGEVVNLGLAILVGLLFLTYFIRGVRDAPHVADYREQFSDCMEGAKNGQERYFCKEHFGEPMLWLQFKECKKDQKNKVCKKILNEQLMDLYK